RCASASPPGTGTPSSPPAYRTSLTQWIRLAILGGNGSRFTVLLAAELGRQVPIERLERGSEVGAKHLLRLHPLAQGGERPDVSGGTGRLEQRAHRQGTVRVQNGRVGASDQRAAPERPERGQRTASGQGAQLAAQGRRCVVLTQVAPLEVLRHALVHPGGDAR